MSENTNSSYPSNDTTSTQSLDHVPAIPPQELNPLLPDSLEAWHEDQFDDLPALGVEGFCPIHETPGQRFLLSIHRLWVQDGNLPLLMGRPPESDFLLSRRPKNHIQRSTTPGTSRDVHTSRQSGQ